LQLTRLGIKALILEDTPLQNGWWVLHLSPDGARFEPGDDLVGLGVYATAPRLLERYGQHVALALIGPGGEMRLGSAGIQNLDKDKVPSRIAARGGLGAVMGSKGLKAIVIDAKNGEKPPIAHMDLFRQAQKEYNKALMAHPQIKVYADYGTAAMPRMSNGFGGLPTRNFSEGTFEHVEKISGEYMRQLLLGRGGESETTHACMAGCTIRCSNIFGGEDGKSIVSPLEYETIGLLGSNLSIPELDDIARMCYQINDLGLDTIEVGAALGVAAEAGLMPFGDGARAMELIDEIARGTPLGRVLGNGATTTGRVFGIEHVPAVKGQAMSAYEPRAIKGTGVTYATSPQGADHTAGLTIRAKVDHLDPTVQIDVSRNTQINMAGYDTLGACIFAGFGFAATPQTIRDLLNARYDWQVGDDILQVLGKETIKLEREFNQRAGFTSAHDRIPEWMTRQPLPPHHAVFDVSEKELDEFFNW
jgi:aldehyde:ferredoxin oxidoreductase